MSDPSPPEDLNLFAPRDEGSERLDKWLWYARFFKTRSLAAKVVTDGKVRVDSVRVSKPARAVTVGNTLTFLQERTVRVVRIIGIPGRRGPAPEARLCYLDLTPPADPDVGMAAESKSGRKGPRPTKKDRRNLDEM